MGSATLSSKKKYFLFSLVFLGWIVDTLMLSGMNVVIIPISNEFGLKESQQGLIVSSFFVSSAIMTLIGGWLSDKFGSRKILITCMLLISAFTLVNGMVGSLAALIAIRFLLGFADGFLPTASAVSITELFNKSERARAKSYLLGAQMIGVILASSMAATLSVSLGWRSVFYIVGGIGVLVTVLLITYYRPPGKGAIPMKQLQKSKVPLKRLVKHPLLWTLVLIYFGISIVNWGSMTWMPTYLSKVRHVDLLSLGFLSMIPSFGGLIASIFIGWLLDKKWGGQEKIVIITCSIISGVCLYLLSHASSVGMVIFYQTIVSVAIMSAMMSILTLPLKVVAPEMVGSFMGVMYFLGAVAGAISPMIIGFLVTRFNGSYDAAFWFLILILIIPILGALMLRNKNHVVAEQQVAV
ncbi:MFS transporter [Paenibacillus sp. FSL R10-2734]|uniref:MFS transporter n=1 Tax=Paenibacillus sp. FSL R10-2734 TaxID=2954691 RepID=UPI0030D72DF8